MSANMSRNVSSAISGHKSSTLGSRIRNLYLRLKEPVAYATAILAAASSLANNTRFQSISLIALLGILIRVLFEIQKKVEDDSSKREPKVFKNVMDAEREMEKCLEECIKRKDEIRIQWIGMTMYNAWNSLVSVITQVAKHQPRKVTVEIAMLESAWLDENHINPAWTGSSADDMERRIRQEFRTHTPDIPNLDWKISINRYAHMPILHGGLINDKYLFLGISQWDGKCLKAGLKPYELHKYIDGDYEADKIEIFKNWFAFCSGQKQDWYKFNKWQKDGAEETKQPMDSGRTMERPLKKA